MRDPFVRLARWASTLVAHPLAFANALIETASAATPREKSPPPAERRFRR